MKDEPGTESSVREHGNDQREDKRKDTNGRFTAQERGSQSIDEIVVLFDFDLANHRKVVHDRLRVIKDETDFRRGKRLVAVGKESSNGFVECLHMLLDLDADLETIELENRVSLTVPFTNDSCSVSSGA